MQQQVHFANGAIRKLAGILDVLSAGTVFLVADEQAYFASGASEEIEPLLGERTVVRFTDFASNPKLTDIEAGIKRYRTVDPSIVLAVGGGSAIDLAKLISVIAPREDSASEVITGKIAAAAGRPVVAIPTTAGTGSEATHFAVAYVNDRKYSVADSALLPAYAIVDPQLTRSLPPRMTATSGLDALCQAVESIWAVGSTTESIGYASEAAELALANLTAAVQQPTPANRLAMSKAAHLSGQAINISKTTASHAMSYALTSRYGVPHGFAVGITLGKMLLYNAGISADDCAEPRGVDHVRTRTKQVLELLGEPTFEKGADRVHKLLVSIDAPTQLSQVGLQGESEIDWLCEQVNAERLLNNPRRLNAGAIRRLLREIW
jgi:alcohol dehydrogenase class IV